MRTDLRVKHDIDARKKAAELFGKGRGFESVAKELSIPRSTVMLESGIIGHPQSRNKMATRSRRRTANLVG